MIAIVRGLAHAARSAIALLLRRQVAVQSRRLPNLCEQLDPRQSLDATDRDDRSDRASPGFLTPRNRAGRAITAEAKCCSAGAVLFDTSGNLLLHWAAKVGLSMRRASTISSDAMISLLCNGKKDANCSS